MLLLVAFLDSTSLTHIYVAERTLLWWLAIFSAVLAVARGLVTEGLTFRLSRAVPYAFLAQA